MQKKREFLCVCVCVKEEGQEEIGFRDTLVCPCE